MTPAPGSLAHSGAAADARPALLFGLVANAVLLGGLLFADWDASAVAALFWAESAIVGIATLIRILVAVTGSLPPEGPGNVTYRRLPRPGRRTSSSTSVPRINRVLAVPLFILSFGVLLLLYGWMLAASLDVDDPAALLAQVGAATGPRAFLLFIVLEQAWSGWRELRFGPDWMRNDPTFHFWRPFGLVFLIWITAFFGFVLFGWLDSAIVVLVVLIVLKTVADAVNAIMDTETGAWVREAPCATRP